MTAPELLATNRAREHQQAILKLEAAELRRLRPIYIDARRALLGRLSELSIETFTAQQYRVAMAQVEAGLDAMKARLRKTTTEIVDRALPLGVQQLLDEIAHWEGVRGFGGEASGRIQLDALRRVSEVRGLLLHNFENSISRYGLDVLADVQRRIGLHLVMRSAWSVVANDITGKLDASAVQGAQWKAERIVRTELHGALNAGRQAALEAAMVELPDLRRQWDATLDKRVCPGCRALNGQVVGIDEPFVFDGDEVAGPPAHPNDRCSVIPYRAAWATEGEGAAVA